MGLSSDLWGGDVEIGSSEFMSLYLFASMFFYVMWFHGPAVVAFFGVRVDFAMVP